MLNISPGHHGGDGGHLGLVPADARVDDGRPRRLDALGQLHDLMGENTTKSDPVRMKGNDQQHDLSQVQPKCRPINHPIFKHTKNTKYTNSSPPTAYLLPGGASLDQIQHAQAVDDDEVLAHGLAHLFDCDERGGGEMVNNGMDWFDETMSSALQTQTDQRSDPIRVINNNFEQLSQCPANALKYSPPQSRAEQQTTPNISYFKHKPSLTNLHWQSHPVLVAASELVAPLVDPLCDELVDEVSLAAHDLHAVVAWLRRYHDA
jgi:hypothetical protein